jgi:hypothetical protein
VRVTTALCATRRHVVERRCKGSAAGLSQQPGEAGGSLIPEARVRAGAAPTKARRVGTRRPSARSARRKGETQVNQWLNPLKRDTGSNLVDVGRIAAHAARWRGRRLRSRPNAVGGEAVGNVCGVPAAMLQGEELVADPVDRCVVNVGTVPASPFPSPLGGGGQARCRLMAPGRGGGSVVVRGRESRPHGEGTQRASRAVAGRSGGRR